MSNGGRFAVQDFARPANAAAVGLDDRLMSKADADNRQAAAQAAQQFRHAACIGRGAGAGRQHQHRIFHLLQPFSQRIGRNGVAVDHHAMTKGTQLIDRVIGKGIDIIEQQDIGHQNVSLQ